MATRPAYVWTGSDFDEIGDKRLGPSVTALNSALAEKVPFQYGTATPTTTVEGFVWYDENDTPPTPKFWDGSEFRTFSAGPADFSDAATGTYTDTGVDYKYITYNSSGTLTVTRAGFADVLVVGGGGGGGRRCGGGGGAGGHLYSTNVYLNAGTATISVGAGGVGGNAPTARFPSGLTGNASGISNFIVAVGGGGGAGSDVAGQNGGSGGGGGGQSGAPPAGGAGFVPQGNDGGIGRNASNDFNGGGGGGADAAGANAPAGAGGGGGAGEANSITGTSVDRAGGGGGGKDGRSAGSGGTGGSGVGGNGSNNNTTGGAGSANTGGGGGGGGFASGDGGPGGAGGSGVVIVRVRT